MTNAPAPFIPAFSSNSPKTIFKLSTVIFRAYLYKCLFTPSIIIFPALATPPANIITSGFIILSNVPNP